MGWPGGPGGRDRAAAGGVGTPAAGGYPVRPWISVTGLAIVAILAVAGFRGSGMVPFFAALGIAAVDVRAVPRGCEALT